MKRNIIFYLSIVLCVLSILVTFAGPFTHRNYLAIIGILGAFFSIFLLAGSATYKPNWKCEKCGEVVTIGIWTYLMSTTGRYNQKKLVCPKCKKKTWCRVIG
jgi:hypothetical protein